MTEKATGRETQYWYTVPRGISDPKMADFLTRLRECWISKLGELAQLRVESKRLDDLDALTP
jgi:hypothetical protein